MHFILVNQDVKIMDSSKSQNYDRQDETKYHRLERLKKLDI